MKKVLSLFVASAFILSAITGCGEGGAKKSPDQNKKGMIKAPEPGKDAVRPDAGKDAKAPEGAKDAKAGGDKEKAPEKK